MSNNLFTSIVPDDVVNEAEKFGVDLNNCYEADIWQAIRKADERCFEWLNMSSCCCNILPDDCIYNRAVLSYAFEFVAYANTNNGRYYNYEHNAWKILNRTGLSTQ